MARKPAATLFVALVALHSWGVGWGLLLIPEWGLELGGFSLTGSEAGAGTGVAALFFARQGGVFHLVVGAAYWAEHRRTGRLDFMIWAKAAAVVFLFGYAATGMPPVVLASGVVDALMLLGALAFQGTFRRRSTAV